jgi:hypothetical protein
LAGYRRTIPDEAPFLDRAGADLCAAARVAARELR